MIINFLHSSYILSTLVILLPVFEYCFRIYYSNIPYIDSYIHEDEETDVVDAIIIMSINNGYCLLAVMYSTKRTMDFLLHEFCGPFYY